VAALLERTTAADPARRPADAASLEAELTALLRELQASRRRWVRAAILVSMAAAGALVGVLLVWIIKDVRARPVVAVADLENTTGDTDLQGLSGLLRTSLEQWTRLSVVPRQRLLSLAADPDRLDCDRARRSAQAAGATAVLCGRVGRDGAGYAIALEVLEPDEGRLVDRLQERTPTRQDLVAAVDRLSARVRGVLFSPLPRPAPRPIGGTTSTTMEALAHYFRGVECADRPVHGQDCGVELRRALEIDPEFGLAAYRLAIWLHWFGGQREEQRALLARAVTNGAGLPEKEQALLHAWVLHLDGRDREAIDLFGEAARRWGADPEPSYQAGDLLRHQDRLAEAASRFEQVIVLQPDHEWALGGLVQCLGPLGREAELRERMARWEADPRPGTLHALSLARGWLGDLPGAAAAAREGQLLSSGPQAQEDLLAARVFAGELEAVEPDLRRWAASRSPTRSMGFYGLAALQAYRGRPKAALAELDALAREIPEVARDAVYHTIRADLLLGTGDARAVWREVEAARVIDARLASEHAVSLAWLGDLEHARLLAADLPADGPLAAATSALVRFRSGDQEGGLAELGRISAATPVFAWRVAPIFLYGALLTEVGRDAEAIDVLKRAQALYLPLAMWRSWAYPRSQLWLARANERLGRRLEARQELGRLLATWARAEEGTSELAAAHELARRVATQPSVQRGER
jgi:predicted Zn-dependent protease